MYLIHRGVYGFFLEKATYLEKIKQLLLIYGK